MRVSVIIPTRNEASALTHVLADLPANLVNEVLVVDSNSTDGTPEIAARMGARVIAEPRRGYGRACLTGIAHASSPDVIVFLDAIIVTARRNCRACSRRSPKGARTSRSVPGWQDRGSEGPCPGMRHWAIAWRHS
jgi:hypothetical protein